MAKISLKSFEELIVTEEKALAVLEEINTKKQEENGGGLPLSAWPITIEHQDGLWCGSLAHIGPISLSEKQKTIKYTFKDDEDLKRFHNEYGYGFFEQYHKPSYGLVDVRTQFLIKTNQAEFKGDNLIIKKINKDAQEKWSDLWRVYESRLDQFNDIR